MERVLKVFVEKSQRATFKQNYQPLEEYDAFVLLKASPAVRARLAKLYPLEDITDQYKIHLETRVVAPGPRYRGTKMAKTARQGINPPDSKPHHFLVQFLGPIKPQWLRKVTQTGGELRQPFEGFTYVVRATQTTMDQIRLLPFVRWVGHLPYRDRIASGLDSQRAGKDKSLSRTRILRDAFVIAFFGPQDAKRAKPAVKKLGFDILDSDPKTDVLSVRFNGKPGKLKASLRALSAVHGLRMVHQRTLDRTCNNVAATIMAPKVAATAAGPLLDGTGEVIAICDTGLDTGDPATIHQDFAGRIDKILSYAITPEIDSYIKNPGANDGPADLDSGHGTHVAGSVLGNGKTSTAVAGIVAPIRGLVSKAHLVFQAVEQETIWKNPVDLKRNGRYGLWGIPSDLKDLFKDAYAAGARIHSNSWGGGKPGEYEEQCRQLDQYVWDHKDFCVVVAAGNDGTDKDGDGKINSMSVTSPGTAKNCITVGASENKRMEFNAEKYGKWWPDDYPVLPFNTDSMANNPDQLAAFSSRGPTKDGRVKPDVVAPGTFILSTRSTQIAKNNKAWSAFPPSDAYFFMGGTSMATPLVSGAVAIVRQYLRTKAGIAKPSAALLKAALIAGATKLPGVSPTTDPYDNDQGFGRVNLDTVLAPPASTVAKFIQGAGLQTGAAKSYAITVTSSTVPLKLVLAYTDFPGTKLINNLNLILNSPDGKTYVGNGKAVGTLLLDATNNVEVARIDSPKKGVWTARIVASNVPKGPQDYALVALGAI